MNEYLLIRDNLSDTGVVPSPGSACASPDLIIHKQVSNPTTFFKENYDVDVNESINLYSTANLIYVRVKNITDSAKNGYIHMYASEASLFLDPQRWLPNKLKDPDNNDFVTTGLMNKGEIGVGKLPFVFDAKKNQLYCHVGFVSSTPDKPDIPSSFPSYSAYYEWIHKCPHICMRNFWTVGGTRNYLDLACEVSNPFQSPKSGTFSVKLIKQYPIGTVVKITCASLNINETRSVTQLMPETLFSIGAVLPASFEDVAILEVILPSGATGPSKGAASFTFWVTPDDPDIIVPSIHVNALGIESDAPHLLKGPKFLIKIGGCTKMFE